VLLDSNGVIACVGCDCAATGGAGVRPTAVLCPGGIISPGFINGHDHLTFPAAPYVAPGITSNGLLFDGGVPERYEHRHDWRVGGSDHDGHTRISNGGSGNADQTRWNELRQLLVGTTSISGSNGAPGLLRNLDMPDTATGASQVNLNANTTGANYETFPFADTRGDELVGTCAYPRRPNPANDVPANAAYLPHIAEGIELSARNEFMCLAGLASGAVDLIGPRTAVIHGIALKPPEIRLVALRGASLVWSPRSNVALYGDTAWAPVYHRMGVNLSLGTDWVRSGSMNLTRELACADYLSQGFFQKYFSALTLWRMVTINAAKAQVVSSRIGVLEAGRVGDVAVHRRKHPDPYRSVITSNPEDVWLTVRGGKVLFGAESVALALGEGCESIEVCGAKRAVCLSGEGTSLATLTAANGSTYPLFFCGAPPANEPTCTPMRGAPWLFSGNPYSGVSSATDDDGDGIPNAADNCPSVFNPRRPMDVGSGQSDADGDGQGDACDVCPLDANVRVCRAPVASDVDQDSIPNDRDNCPGDPNTAQSDDDGDGKGNACDPCPSAANAGGALCPLPPGIAATIYEVKAPGSVLVNQRVQLSEVLVTATNALGFFAQVHPNDPGYRGPEYSAVFVFYPGSSNRTDVVAGDRVTISSGAVADFQGQIQVNSIRAGGVTVTARGNALPSPVVATVQEVNGSIAAKARALEGVLVALSGPVTVVDIMPAPGMNDTVPTNEFAVAEMLNGPSLRVNDFFYALAPFPAVGDPLTGVRGVLQFRNGNYKLEPRSAFDVTRPVALGAFGPSEQFLRVSQSRSVTFPVGVSVRLTSPAVTDTFVSIRSSNPNVLEAVDGGIWFVAGRVEAPVVFEVASNPSTGAFPDAGLPDGGVDRRVVLSAALASDAGGTLTSTVRVLLQGEGPTSVTLTPSMTSVVAGGTVKISVLLDVPALAGGAVVSLGASGMVGGVPATVTVAEGQVSADVVFTAAPMVSGSSTVTATFGGVSSSAQVNVLASARANHVVVSEIQTRGTTAGDEFVELYNPTNAPVNITGWKLQYKAAAGAAYQDRAVFPPNTVIAPRSYFLITSVRGATGFSSTVASDLATNGVLGLADVGHLRLGPAAVSTMPNDQAAVDTVGYGAGANAPETMPAPSPSAGGSVERKANASSTSASMSSGNDALEGNGEDTDNNAVDFVVRTQSQPQNSMSAPEP
jgi:hypothetical protein